jgi:hypothetical protein
MLSSTLEPPVCRRPDAAGPLFAGGVPSRGLRATGRASEQRRAKRLAEASGIAKGGNYAIISRKGRA